jgi:hypothetical protein
MVQELGADRGSISVVVAQISSALDVDRASAEKILSVTARAIVGAVASSPADQTEAELMAEIVRAAATGSFSATKNAQDGANEPYLAVPVDEASEDEGAYGYDSWDLNGGVAESAHGSGGGRED